MREESHLDDMRAAIRGDFERLKERRGEQDLMVPSEDEADSKTDEEPEVTEPAASEPQPSAEEPSSDEPATPEEPPLVTGDLTAPELHEPEPEPEPDEHDDASVEEPAQRSWLDHLLGR